MLTYPLAIENVKFWFVSKEFGEPVNARRALAMAPLPANSPQDSPQLALIPPLLEQLFPVSAALAAKKLDVPLPV